MNSGQKSSRGYPSSAVAGDRGKIVAGCWKAFSGYSKPGPAGVTCPKNIPVPAPVGDACASGKNRKSGSRSGASSCPNWTSSKSWTGVSRLWTGVSLPLKKGLPGWQNQAGQRHEVDGGGRRRGYSSGSATARGQSGGSHARRLYPASTASGVAAQSTAADCRPGVRQRFAAPTLGRPGHRVDLSAPPGPQETSDPGRPLLAPLPPPLEDRADLRLVGKLPPTRGSVRTQSSDVRSFLSHRLLSHHPPTLMKPLLTLLVHQKIESGQPDNSTFKFWDNRPL